MNQVKPKNRPQLWAFIGSDFSISLPFQSFTEGHSTPFDFVADAFFHPEQDLAAWANRSGGKTLASSIIAALEYLFYDQDQALHSRVLSGSEDQAKNLYGYWQQWCYDTLLRSKLKDDPGRMLTRLSNGDVEILAASQKRVRGAKVQRLYRDEIDEIEPEILGASVGMLASINGTPARSIDTSTWHHPAGPMGKLVENAEARGIRLHKWGVWESIACCPQNRHDNGRNCGTCPLGPVCLEKARTRNPRAKKGIASQASGIFAINDAIKQYRQWSKQQWEAEAECKRPSLQGLVYPQFDRALHVKVDLDFQDALPTCRAIDFGLNDFVCLWIQHDKAGRIFVVDEYWATDATVATNAAAINRLDADAQIEATYCDPAGRNRNDQTGYSDIDVLKSAGIPCRYTMSRLATEIANGINLIRAALAPASGRPRLFIAGKCKRLIEAFESYKLRKVNNEWIDEPIKPQPCDHPMDALRYYFVNRHSTSKTKVGYLKYT